MDEETGSHISRLCFEGIQERSTALVSPFRPLTSCKPLVFPQPVEDRLRQPFGMVPMNIVPSVFCFQHLHAA